MNKALIFSDSDNNTLITVQEVLDNLNSGAYERKKLPEFVDLEYDKSKRIRWHFSEPKPLHCISVF